MGSTSIRSANLGSTAPRLHAVARPISSGFLALQEGWRPDKGTTAVRRIDDAGGHRSLECAKQGRLSLSIDARQSMIHCALIPKNSTGRQHARPEPGHASWKDTP